MTNKGLAIFVLDSAWIAICALMFFHCVRSVIVSIRCGAFRVQGITKATVQGDPVGFWMAMTTFSIVAYYCAKLLLRWVMDVTPF